MMRIIRPIAILILLFAQASCARAAAPGAPGEPSPEVTSSALPRPSALGPSELPAAMRPNEARPDTRVVALRPVRWTRVEAAQGRQVRVYYTITGRGNCAALGRVDVAETATTVTITVRVGRLPDADCTGPQSQLAASMMTVVTLAQPLGTRTAKDGALG
jgi:hypothetical protein